MKRDSRLIPWLSTALLAVAGLLPLLKAIRGGYDAGTIPGVLLGVASVVFVFAAIDTVNSARLRALRRDNPHAFVSNIVTYRPLPQQLLDVQTQLGISTGKVRASSYGSVCIDSDAIRFYGGSWRPRMVASLPVSRITDVRLEIRPQGKWNLACIELEFSSATARSVLDLTMMTTRWGLPGVASPQSRKDAVTRIKSIRALADNPHN